MNRRKFLSVSALAAVAEVSTFGDSNRPIVLPPNGAVQTGGARRIDIGGGHWVWTKKVGEGATKVLLLHGGPGADHRYFECFESFLPPNGIEFYYYDQLDSTNSDKPNDPRLWTIERYTQEVESVRNGLGLEHFYLLGHSWGGVLAVEYALEYQHHLKGLVISNMAASTASFVNYVQKIRAQYPKDLQETLARYEDSGQTDAPAYQELLMEKLYKQFICRLEPWPDPLERSLSGWNQRVYKAIQGRSEFEATGVMKGWDRWEDLHRIQVPTLVLGAQYDEMDSADLKRMATLMPKGQSWISAAGSHFAMYDDQRNYFRTLLKFLRS